MRTRTRPPVSSDPIPPDGEDAGTPSARDVLLALLAALAVAIYRWVRVPPELRHIPKAPILPLLYSYLSGEVEEQRVKRVVLPFARRARTNVVLVFCLGEWMIHVVEAKAGKQFMESRAVRKQEPPPEMLLWRLTGRQNVFTAEGEMWKRHSKIIHEALYRTTPIEQFANLARKTFAMMGDGGRIRWSDYTHRFTLDAVGTTVIGYDFEALDKPNGPFVKMYHDVMEAISNPPYIFLPSLERWMFENPDMTETEFRDNVIVIRSRTRQPGRYPLLCMCWVNTRIYRLNAIIRESMRYNNPSNVTIPRLADVPLQVGDYIIPPQTPIILNMCAILHNDTLWSHPEKFDPDRFMESSRFDENNWTPFGLGPRQCPARSFSLYEQRVMISMLLRDYEWRVPEDSIHRGQIKNAFSRDSLYTTHVMLSSSGILVRI